MRSLPLLAIKKTNLSHYTCRSRNALLFRLAGSMGTFTRTCTDYCRSCPQSQLVLQRRLRCVCHFMVSLGSLCCFGRQNRHLFSGRQQCGTQTLSGTSCTLFQMFLSLSLCFALCRPFVCLLLQPTSIEKTALP